MNWRPIPDLPGYAASDEGLIKHILTNHILPQTLYVNGYARVRVGKKGFRVHRLVASAFLGPCPPGKEVNHLDSRRAHNFVSNLEYVTRSREHVARRKARPPGQNAPARRRQRPSQAFRR